MEENTIQKQAFNVSVIVSYGQEGRLLQHNLRSIIAAMQYAQDNGVTSELILVGVNSDSDTELYLKSAAIALLDQVTYCVSNVEYRDIGTARNKAVRLANNELISFVNGKDLVSENWLLDARNLLKQSEQPIIVHPQYELSFGAKDRLREIKSSTDPYFSHEGMVEEDYFCPTMMTARSLALQHPYSENNEEGGYGFTEWLWDCETLAAGVGHIVVPQTLYADRWHEVDSRFNNNDKLLLPKTGYLQSYSKELAATNEDNSTKNKLGFNERNLNRTRDFIAFMYRTKFTRWVGGLHPRLGIYLTALRNETLHLFRPTEAAIHQPIPDWLLKRVQELHEFDRRIFFSQHLQNVIERYAFSPGSYTRAYWHLANSIEAKADILFIVPYLKNGGAERELANIIEYSLKVDPDNKIKIIATDPFDSPWASEINDKVTFVETDNDFHTLPEYLQAKLLATLCVQLVPRKMHIMNSVCGYMAIQYYGSTIKKNTQMFITIFMIDKTEEGRYTHVFTDRMQKSIDYVEKVFTDNYTVVDQLSELMGVNKNKFSVHYQPADISSIAASKDTIENRFKKPPLKVLWAGRLDRQKRPDIFIQIADKASRMDMAVEFYAYGSPAFEDNSYLKALENSTHITYGGGYTGGLKSLPLQNFDVFLMTSEWEGMPNVLLEAIVAGLLPIAPHVGGVAEIIINGKTGILIEHYNDIDSYIESLSAVGSMERPQKLIHEAQALVLERHTQEKYEERISKEKAYLS